MALELGALELAIRDSGGAELLGTLKRIEGEAKKVGSTNVTPRFHPETVARALAGMREAKGTTDRVAGAQRSLANEIAEGTRLFSLQARTVDVTSKAAVQELRASAAAQRDWLVSVGASTEQQLKFAQATQVLEQRMLRAERAQAAQARAAERAARASDVAGRRFTNVQGSLVGAGRASLTMLNAVAFSVSQFAATGEASFRSLATAVATFAAFFGPAGAITSLVASTGLALTDFFTRKQRELKALTDAAIEESKRARREVDLAFRAGDRDALTRRAKELQDGTVDRQGVVDLQKRARDLQRQIDDKQAELTRTADRLTIDQRQTLAREIAGLKQQRARAVVDLATLEDEIANLMQKVQDAPIARPEERETITVTADAVKSITKERDAQIGALETLAKLEQFNVGYVRAANALHADLTRQLERQTNSLEEQAKLLQQMQRLRATGFLGAESAAPVSPLGVRTTPTLGGPLNAGVIAAQLAAPDALRNAFAESLRKAINNERVGASMRAALEEVWKRASARGFKLDAKFEFETEALLQAAADVDAQFASLGANIVGVLGDAIGAAFSGGDVGKTLLAGMGAIFQQMGQALLVYGATMVGLLPAFSNPFTSGPAALAAGAALLALGSAMGGAANGTKGAGASARVAGAQPSSYTDRETIPDSYIRRATLPKGAQPSTARAATLQPMGPPLTVIGVDSPLGTRLIGTSASKFKRRGG